MNRRDFIINSTVTLLGAVAGYSYFFGKCALDAAGNGVCPSACAAFLDLNGDGICDRLPDSAIPAARQARLAANEHPTVNLACPLNLVNDPYPGACNLYIDANGDGICDLSQHLPLLAAAAVAPVVAATSAPPDPTDAPQPQTVCPLGLVNDPYPGACTLYIDADSNGICDLSEPARGASGAIVPPPPPTREPTPPGVTPTPQPQTACPYGLVNDPYPGKCKWYVDADNNGICDLSEPARVASGDVVSPVDGSEASSSNTQRRRRGRDK